jgi:hypothetical protein
VSAKTVLQCPCRPMCSARDPTLAGLGETHVRIRIDFKQHSCMGARHRSSSTPAASPFLSLFSAASLRAAFSCAPLSCAALSRAPDKLSEDIFSPVVPEAGALAYLGFRNLTHP